jgi:hypothetical protein
MPKAGKWGIEAGIIARFISPRPFFDNRESHTGKVSTVLASNFRESH